MFVTGLEFETGEPKPIYGAWRMPLYLPRTVEHRGSSLEVWGCVRPARYAQLDTGRPQTAKIELRPSGSGRFQVVQALTILDPNGYFDIRVRFSSAGNIRLAWSYPHGPTVYSREVAISVS
jgi:hypothetical protein